MSDNPFDLLTDDEVKLIITDWQLPRLHTEAGIDQRWLHSFVASRIADLLAQTVLEERLHNLPPTDRAWLRARAEDVVSSAVAHYTSLT